jgi:hypothetical protein
MNDEIWEQWVSDWKAVLASMRRKGFEASDLEIGKPVSRHDLDRIAAAHSLELPADFMDVLTRYASRVSFRWHLQDHDLPDPFSQIFAGWSEFLWDVEALGRLKREYTRWITDCFADPEDTYDRVWHGKTACLEVPNGDMIAFDTSAGLTACPVIYLSHDDGELHGCRLGTDFVDFVTRWSSLGCPGPEDWQIEPFYDHANECIDDAGEAVARWKEWLAQ